MHDSAFPERLFGLERADGEGPIRPGTTLSLRFRLRNARTTSTAAARVTFRLPPGWQPLEPAQVDLSPLAGGEERTIPFHVRDSLSEPRSGAFQALVECDGEQWGSNVVRVEVRGRAAFTVPPSRVRLRTGGEAGTLTALVEAVNTGDATARELRIVAPAPPGFTSAGPAEQHHGDLAPGASASCAFAYRALAGAADVVRLEDVAAVWAEGSETLPPAEPLALAPAIAVELTAQRADGRLDVAVLLRNDGATAAHDLTGTLALPAGWKVVRAALPSVLIPGANGELRLAVPLLPAAEQLGLRAVATAPRRHPGGVLRLVCGDVVADAAVEPPRERRWRVAAACDRATVAPGAPLLLRVAVWNEGETNETAELSAGPLARTLVELAAGAATIVELAAVLPEEAGAAADLLLPVVAAAPDGAVLGRAAVALRRATPRATSLPALVEPAVAATLTAPPEARAGEPFPVALRLDVRRPVRRVTLLVELAPPAGYVSGSARVDGRRLVDGLDGPPLLREGLALADLTPGTIVVDWTVVAPGGGIVEQQVGIDADGQPVALARVATTVAEPPAFAVRPAGCSYYIAASVLDAPPAPLPQPAPPAPSLAFTLRLDELRCGMVLRLLQGSGGSGIVTHLPLLAALFPDAAGDDPGLAAALAAAREAIRSVYERLFVKVRIPNYDVTPYDLEDAPARASLLGLLDAAADAAPRTSPGGADLAVEVPRGRLTAARTRLEGEPLGAAEAVAAAALLLPRTGRAPAARGLGDYAAALAEELDAARSLGLDAFAAYLAHHHVPALDRARREALRALSGDGAVPGTVLR